MTSTFRLTISSVTETVFDGAVVSATLPGTDGELTVLPHHEPLVTTLNSGTITVRTSSDEPKEIPARAGVLEISNNRAIVLL